MIILGQGQGWNTSEKIMKWDWWYRRNAEEVTCIAGWPWEGWNPSEQIDLGTHFIWQGPSLPHVPPSLPPRCSQVLVKKPHPHLNMGGARFKWKADGLSLCSGFSSMFSFENRAVPIEFNERFSYLTPFTLPDARFWSLFIKATCAEFFDDL